MDAEISREADISLAQSAGAALVVVDLQRGFLTEDTRPLCRRIEIFQRNFRHVVATRFHHRRDSLLCRLLGIEGFREGSPETELAFAPPTDARIIAKGSYSCVTPGFVTLMRSWKVSDVYLCGLDTDQCVLMIAGNLLENDLKPIVCADLTASVAGKCYHDAGLFLLQRLIGREQIQRSTEIAAALNRRG